jgi:hypothetical protein
MKESSVFTASKDVVDSLKLEISNNPPRLDEEVKFLVTQVADEITALHGPFIPKSAYKKTEGMEHRVVITDTELFKMMHLVWNTGNPSLPDDDVAGTLFYQGNITLLKDPLELWDSWPESFRADLADQCGGEKEVKLEAGWIGLLYTIVHETIHQFQDHELPEEFLDSAAYYYQEQIIARFNLVFEYFETPKLISLYSDLLQEFGDDVHRLAFGGKLNFRKKVKILRAFYEKADLFEDQ